MKILQINATLGYASTGIIAADIGALVEAKGGEAFYACQTCQNPPKNSLRIGNSTDWKLHALFCRIFGKQAYFSVGATKKLLKYISSVKPDIVHLHNLHSNYVNINMLFKYLAKKDIATVITMHDCWFFTGKCFHYADIGCDKFKTGCGACPKKYAPPKSLFFDTSASVLKTKIRLIKSVPRLVLVGCSKWICKEAEKSLLKDCLTEHIYNGIDTDIFYKKDVSDLRASLCKKDELLVMGMANKWLLPANIGITEKVSALPKTKLMLVGCTPGQISYINKKYQNVLAVGFIKSREALANYYSAADVFVNLTYADTLPTVNMESICCGTPVITYNSCGSPELVDANTGIVVEKGCESALVDAIKNFNAADFTNCDKTGKEKYDKHSNYNKYIELYKKILSK